MALPFRAAKSILKPPVSLRDLRHPVFNGCIAAYLFNEGGGLTIFDVAKQQSILFSGTMNWTQGPHGPALNLNGAKGVGGTAAIDPFSIALWVNASTLSPANQVPFCKVDNAVANGWYADIQSAGTGISFNFATAGGVFRCQAGFSQFTTGWHFVAFYWDRTGNSATPANTGMFLDGKVITPTVIGAVGAPASDSGQVMTFGTFNDGTSPMSDGQLGAAFFWNRIITISEMQDLYVATYPAYKAPVLSKLGAQTFTQTLTAGMATFAGALPRRTNIPITAGMATFAGAVTTPHNASVTITAGMATFAAILTRRTSRTFTAGMSTFSGALGKLMRLGRTTFNAGMALFAGAVVTATGNIKSAFNVSMNMFAGALTRQTNKLLTAGMATFSGALTAIKIATGNSATFNAGMATFAGALIKQTNLVFNANMAMFSATLNLSVQHGGVPPVCIPAACVTIPTIISHVEQCENPGS